MVVLSSGIASVFSAAEDSLTGRKSAQEERVKRSAASKNTDIIFLSIFGFLRLSIVCNHYILFPFLFQVPQSILGEFFLSFKKEKTS
jgi:hypothetical protein